METGGGTGMTSYQLVTRKNNVLRICIVKTLD